MEEIEMVVAEFKRAVRRGYASELQDKISQLLKNASAEVADWSMDRALSAYICAMQEVLKILNEELKDE